MYYAELDGDIVRHVGGGDDYTILPPNSIEIQNIDDVHEGMIYEDGAFRESTSADINERDVVLFNAERDRLFSVTQWARERHSDRVDSGINDSVNWSEWLQYWQLLRDLPDTDGFDLRTPNWPEVPK